MENMTISKLIRPTSEEAKLAKTLTLGSRLQIYVTIIPWYFSHSDSTVFFYGTQNLIHTESVNKKPGLLGLYPFPFTQQLVPFNALPVHSGGRAWQL